MKGALLSNATVVALAHNHPSGNISPSKDDDMLTRKIAEACRTMRLHFLDHVIITDGDYYSYREQGKI
jgi:DNA repair protein RadC